MVLKKNDVLEEKETIIILDKLLAHGLYGKKCLGSRPEHPFIIYNIEDVDNTHLKEIMENISPTCYTAILFIYDKEDIYQILPFIHKEMNIILCADSLNIEWLSHNFPRISLLNITIPKIELFRKIKKTITMFRLKTKER